MKAKKRNNAAALLWESLRAEPAEKSPPTMRPANRAGGNVRLPFDRRCAALTRSGKRCKGRIRNEGEFCPFHDPALAEQRKRQLAQARVARQRNSLAHLPDGYLRKLTDRRAVGQAMDRLYREVRLGRVTVEMGNVLFGILARLMDSGLIPDGRDEAAWRRTKARRLRPKLSELLTTAERQAWRKAVADAPDSFLRGRDLVQASPVKAAAEASRPARPPKPALTVVS